MTNNLEAYYYSLVISDKIYLPRLIGSSPILTDELRDEITAKVMHEIKILDVKTSQTEAIFGYLEDITNSKFTGNTE